MSSPTLGDSFSPHFFGGKQISYTTGEIIDEHGRVIKGPDGRSLTVEHGTVVPK